MRRFANLFLTLFLLDGVISVVDELVTLSSQDSFLSGFRTIIAGVVIIMATPMYISLGIDKRLPKRIFLPLILFLFWCAVGTWFFPFLAKNSIYGLLMSACQIFLCYLPLSHFHCRGRFGMQLPETLFRQPFFSLRNTLLFGSANLVISPLVLVLIVLSATDSVISEKTSGFVRLTPAGLCMTERVYRLDNKTIRLVSMIHVGEQAFYSDLFKPTTAGRTIVLAEGVADQDNLLRTAPNYGKMAAYLGLTSQEGMRFKGRQIDDEEIEEPGFDPGKEGIPDILRADVDVRTFSPSTLHFLEAIGKLLKESDSLVQGVLAINTWTEKNITPDESKSIFEDILHRRNTVLVNHLAQVLPRYDMIIIPWGALHMAEIEESVLKRGFVLQEEQSRVSIDFRKLIARKIH